MKKWYLSKTIWINTLTFLAALIPMIHGFLFDTFAINAGIMLTILAAVNVILRVISGTKITP